MTTAELKEVWGVLDRIEHAISGIDLLISQERDRVKVTNHRITTLRNERSKIANSKTKIKDIYDM